MSIGTLSWYDGVAIFGVISGQSGETFSFNTKRILFSFA